MKICNDAILIVGASSDIGLSFLKTISDEINIIAVCNNNCDLIEKLKKKNININKIDLEKIDDLQAMLELMILKNILPSKIVHLPAPKISNIRFKDQSWNFFERELNIQVRSLFIIVNMLIPHLIKEKKKCDIVSMLSSYVIGVPPSALAHYVTAKYALLGLTKSIASEYSSKGIRINSISPSMVDTKFIDNINEKLVEISASNNPMSRNASADEISSVIKFLLSEESSYINGINVPIAGGSIF